MVPKLLGVTPHRAAQDLGFYETNLNLCRAGRRRGALALAHMLHQALAPPRACPRGYYTRPRSREAL